MRYLFWLPVLLLLACAPPPAPSKHLAQAPPRGATPGESYPLCQADSPDIGAWAADCQVRCLPFLRPALLCHAIEGPHAILSAPPRFLWAGARDGQCGEMAAWRIYQLQIEERPPDALDMNLGASWPGVTVDDCAHRPATFDPDYFAHNPPSAHRLYYRLTEVFPAD